MSTILPILCGVAALALLLAFWRRPVEIKDHCPHGWPLDQAAWECEDCCHAVTRACAESVEITDQYLFEQAKRLTRDALITRVVKLQGDINYLAREGIGVYDDERGRKIVGVDPACWRRQDHIEYTASDEDEDYERDIPF